MVQTARRAIRSRKRLLDPSTYRGGYAIGLVQPLTRPACRAGALCGWDLEPKIDGFIGELLVKRNGIGLHHE